MIRIALMGAGRMGNVHAQNIVHMTNAKLIAVYDPAQDQARALAEKWGCDAVPTLEASLQRGDIDAVVIASSSDSHGQLIVEAARARKAIYCDKPIATDLDCARKAVAAVEEAGVPGMTGFHRRFMPQYVALRNEIDKGFVGRIKTIAIISREPKLHPIPYLRASGGMYRDRAVHGFDLIRWFTGLEPTEVHVMGGALEEPALEEISDQDTALILLRMEGGPFCHIEYTRLCCYGFDERIEVFGTAGMVEAGRANHNSRPGLARFTTGKAIYDGVPGHEIFDNNFNLVLTAFVDALEQGRQLEPSLADGFKAQVASEAATRSQVTGQPVPIRY